MITAFPIYTDKVTTYGRHKSDTNEPYCTLLLDNGFFPIYQPGENIVVHKHPSITLSCFFWTSEAILMTLHLDARH